jgi:hypothetical protein
VPWIPCYSAPWYCSCPIKWWKSLTISMNLINCFNLCVLTHFLLIWWCK